MRSGVVLSIAAALASTGAAPGGVPTLRAAGASNAHIVVALSPGDLVPGQIAVATQATRTANRSFLPANVRLRERIVAKPDPVTGIVRFRTHGTVARGV